MPHDVAFDTLMGLPVPAPQIGKKLGRIRFAGNLWPVSTVNDRDVPQAFQQAIELSSVGYQLAANARRAAKSPAARQADPRAIEIMERWFGAQTGAPRDWWAGVERTLLLINGFLVKNVDVYYRGAEALGKPDDYPGAGVRTITAHDVSGYAETQGGDQDGVVGLCTAFFAQTRKGDRTVHLTGFDCVGGVLIHELSHNLCDTEDHEYSLADAKLLAINEPEKAWYNADSIEYFCEEALFGDKPAAPPVTTDAVHGVAAVSSQVTTPAPVPGPKPAIDTKATTGIKELTKTVTAPSKPATKEKVETKAESSVSALRDNFTNKPPKS